MINQYKKFYVKIKNVLKAYKTPHNRRHECRNFTVGEFIMGEELSGTPVVWVHVAVSQWPATTPWRQTNEQFDKRTNRLTLAPRKAAAAK